MALLSKSQIKELVESTLTPCISIYMPAITAGAETRQNSIRFKNLVGQVEDKIESDKLNLTPAQIQSMLEPARDLINNEQFWQHQDCGLAVFIAPGMFRYYRIPLKLEEQAIVGDRFLVKPLLPLFTNDSTFYLLALSQNEVKLYLGSQYGIVPVELPEEVPTSLDQALQYDDPEAQLQFHSGSGPSGEGGRMAGSKSAPTYHGQGVGTTDNKEDIRRFLTKVEKTLFDQLFNDQQTPLVLASVEYLQPIYQEINSYPYLVEQGITGNPENVRPEELQQQAWSIIKTRFEQEKQEAVDSYQELKGVGQANHTLESVVPAAYQGQVGTLFVRRGEPIWGRYNAMDNRIEIHQQQQEGDTDLLDFAAVFTFLQSGKVYVVNSEQMPEDSPVVAVYRYPQVQGTAAVANPS